MMHLNSTQAVQGRQWNWSLDEFIRVKGLLPAAPADQEHHTLWAQNFDVLANELEPTPTLLTFVYRRNIGAWQFLLDGHLKGIFFTR